MLAQNSNVERHREDANSVFAHASNNTMFQDFKKLDGIVNIPTNANNKVIFPSGNVYCFMRSDRVRKDPGLVRSAYEWQAAPCRWHEIRALI